MDLTALRNNSGHLPATLTVPPLRSAVSVRALSFLEFAALLPPAVVSAMERGIGWLWALLMALAAALLWQRVFAEVRRRPFTPDGIVTALACAIVLPTSTPLWQIALSLSFGIVIGQEIFGGRGRNFLNPATVTLAFMIFSFPGSHLETLTIAVNLSLLPGALLMLIWGLISWRVLVGAIAGLLLMTAVATTALPSVLIVQGGFLFGLVFLAADPVAAASTNPGRWIYGVFFGSTTALLAGGGATRIEMVVSAALLASVLAPLIDSGVIALNVYRRGQRHG